MTMTTKTKCPRHSKTLENTKNSLDLIYEKKHRTKCSSDFEKTTIHSNNYVIPKSQRAIPRSVSDISGNKVLSKNCRSRRDRSVVHLLYEDIKTHERETFSRMGFVRSRSATCPRKSKSDHMLTLKTSDDAELLPDGSCFSRTIHKPNLRRNFNRKSAAIRTAMYIGSFPVSGPDHNARADFVRAQLPQLKDRNSSKPVLLVISLAGIKVCSADGKSVHMAHALRRISYATCDPDAAQFSFLAREPRGHFTLQHCHAFSTQTPEQAEELNSIVGNAFRMAYAAQLQRQPTFQEVIASQLVVDGKDMSVSLRLGGGKDPPRTIPGLQSYLNGNQGDSNGEHHPVSTVSTPSSDESNSPTELNSYKRLIEKPPLVKRLTMTMGLTNHERQPSVNDDAENRPLVSSPTNQMLRSNCGYVNEAVTDTENSVKNTAICKIIDDVDDANRLLSKINEDATMTKSSSKRVSQISSSSSSAGSTMNHHNHHLNNNHHYQPSAPPPPARIDSLTGRPEEGELRAAPWFQAGIPREITLEVLGQEPVGAFMVRESTSKPGCYALSLRVPRDFQPSGIAHYLILRTVKGYKIKGFTKEFSSLTALITHHSVMPELLPCPLSLSRFNASFVHAERDFADFDSDPDYDTLADFRRMMADLDV